MRGWRDGWMGGGEGWVDGWMRGIGGRWAEREGQREYRFSSLMKLKKKRKITLSFTSPEKEFFFLY